MDSKALFVFWLIGWSLTQSLSWFIYYNYAPKQDSGSTGLAALISLGFWFFITVNLWPF